MYCGNIWQVLIMSMECPKALLNNVTTVFFVVQMDFLKDVKCFENGTHLHYNATSFGS
jgi:hypothetical protein